MKKDVKTLIKRLTLLVQFKQTGKGWIAIDGDGTAYLFLKHKPEFIPSGESESLDGWFEGKLRGGSIHLSSLDNLPLSMACPSLASREALFYTDGETVWLVETK